MTENISEKTSGSISAKVSARICKAIDVTKTSETAKTKHYILQGVIAALVLGLVLVLLHGVAGSVLLAGSLASTTFLIFARPHSPEACARNIVGGHVVAISIGAVLALLAAKLGAGEQVELILGAVAVGLALIVMAITDTEHAPAAGVALAMTIAHADLFVVSATTVSGAALLTIARAIFAKRLYDLT